MSDLDVIASVTRDHLGLPELYLNDGVGFTLARTVEVGQVTWRKETVTSPFVHGRIPVHETKEASESRMAVWVSGSTMFDVHERLNELLQAFTEQYDYTLTLTVEGRTNAWRCERADYDVGFTQEFIASLYVPVGLTFHRHPIPVLGGF